MEIITIESKAYQELIAKLDIILQYVKQQKYRQQKEQRSVQLITSEEVAELLGISTRTLQRLRSNDRINYKIIYNRCYYDLADIEQAICDGILYCNPKNLLELHRNFKLKVTKKNGTIR